MTKWTIYAICDPRDDSVFYVGQTTFLAKRMMHHMRRQNEERTCRYIRDLMVQRIVPTFKILCVCTSREEAQRMEYHHIANQIDRGAQLENSEMEIDRALAHVAAFGTAEKAA